MSRRYALYATWSPAGTSDMVLRQIRMLTEAGYSVIVLCNSRNVDSRLHDAAAFVLHRPYNYGFDFGAWREALHRMEFLLWADELLLVNDSCLGPTRPLGPQIERLRGRPARVMGLTECPLYRQHVQSYFLMVKGGEAIGALRHFLLEIMQPIATKTDAIRHGEIALSAHLIGDGIAVGAEYGYHAMIDWTIANDPDWMLHIRPPTKRQERRHGEHAWTSCALLRDRIGKRPLNPTHHLWLPLLRRGMPFVKRDLVASNPARAPGVQCFDHWWTSLDPVTPLAEVREHLRLMSGDACI